MIGRARLKVMLIRGKGGDGYVRTCNDGGWF